MEGSNYWGKWLQDSAFLSEVAVNPLKKARGEIWPRHSEKETTQNYQDEDKKSVINKKYKKFQIKKPHLKMIPIKDNKNKTIVCSTCQNSC